MADHVCNFIDLGGQKCCTCGAWKAPTRPVADPSPEVVAAALALAEADSAWYGPSSTPPEPGWDADSKAHYLALQRYREAIAPKRSRAEIFKAIDNGVDARPMAKGER
jgi:hypothetical protein